jgi:hypothetical protein
MVAAHSCAGRSRRNCRIGREEVAGPWRNGREALPSIRVGGAAEIESKERKDRGDAAVHATRQCLRQCRPVELHFQKGLPGASAQAAAAVRNTATNSAVLDAFARGWRAISSSPGQALRHRIARGSEHLARRKILDVSGRAVEASCGLGAVERASVIPALDCARFQCPQQCSTDTLESRGWRHVVQRDLAPLGNRSDADNGSASHRQNHRIARQCNPRCDDLGGLVGQPPRQYFGVIVMIGSA